MIIKEYNLINYLYNNIHFILNIYLKYEVYLIKLIF